MREDRIRLRIHFTHPAQSSGHYLLFFAPSANKTSGRERNPSLRLGAIQPRSWPTRRARNLFDFPDLP